MRVLVSGSDFNEFDCGGGEFGVILKGCTRESQHQLRRVTDRATANVQRFHSLLHDAAQALFCTLCARWVGAVVQRLGGENTPRRSSAR